MDTVRLSLQANNSQGSTAVLVHQDKDGDETGVIAVPSDEWAQARVEVQRHYDLSNSTRVDCINIITALTLALSDR